MSALSSHSSYEELALARRENPDYRAGHVEARQACLIGQAVRERRLALGLSVDELAALADMTQPTLSRLEAGGTVPTIPLLEWIAAALDADLGYNATRFLEMLSEQGGLATARQLLWSDTPSDAFTTLWSRRRLELTVEAHVLQQPYATLFSDDDRQRVRDRLAAYGWHEATRAG